MTRAAPAAARSDWLVLDPVYNFYYLLCLIYIIRFTQLNMTNICDKTPGHEIW